ncbi:ABC transporter ATP-binding protein [Krasilnikovia sp. M28-CT-15]|uniref:ABC transporter ATP-binding protein n=1 Tax=Krasilnikovia sp. M28-CT-15 TaxID=3373540 RepID=UPI0038775D77
MVADVPAIEIRNLSHRYRTRSAQRRPRWTEKVALDGVNLRIPQGEIHGLLGPNGAGKSTLCKILSTVLVPSEGDVRVLGHSVVDYQRVRSRLALVLGGDQGLYSRLTARQNLLFWGSLYGCTRSQAQERADRLINRVGLGGRGDDRVETFSRGMKQRLHLARGLIGDPRVLLLDEPTNGMDPVGQRDFRDLIVEVCAGRTILLATHDMVEAEKLCHRVSLVNGGKIIATESPQTLGTWISRFERVDTGALEPIHMDRLRAMSGVGSVRATDDGTRIETVRPGAAGDVIRYLLDAGHVDIRTSLPSLEEVYLHLMAPDARSTDAWSAA